jgi:hypothetical protein
MGELTVQIAAVIVAVISVAVAYLKRQLDGIDKHVNHKTRYGRTESLYELAHKNDLVQEQMLELVKTVKTNVEHNGDAVDKLTRSHLRDKKDLHEFKTEVRSRLDKLETKEDN